MQNKANLTKNATVMTKPESFNRLPREGQGLNFKTQRMLELGSLRSLRPSSLNKCKCGYLGTIGMEMRWPTEMLVEQLSSSTEALIFLFFPLLCPERFSLSLNFL